MKFISASKGGVILAVAGLAALAGCSSSGSSSSTSSTSSGASTSSTGAPGAFGSVPAEATGTQHTGTITVAEPPSSAPTWILPIITGAANSVYTADMFEYQMYRPLYWFVNGVEPKQTPSMSLANAPVWSNGDKTVSITLKSNYKWSNGDPITSKDILFWYDEMKAAIAENASNWVGYTPGLGIPDEVASVATPNSSTFVFNMKKAVNPTWFWQDVIGSIQPMPSAVWAKASASGPTLNFTVPANAKKIYNFLSAASKSESTYASNPLWQVVDGPYKLTSFDSSSGAFSMTPNTTYGGPHANTESPWKAVAYTSDTAEFNAVKSGSVDVGYIPATDVPQAASLKSTYNEFGYTDFGWSYVTYNFADHTGNFNNIINKLYIRQALAHLENEPGYIHAFFDGAGGQGFGPVPQYPKSPYTPANAATNPYPFSTAAAEKLLKDNGWKVVPNGTDTCIKPGTAAGDCGAGIPAGQKLTWNVIYNTSPSIIGSQVEDWASEAKQVGITMNLSTSNFNYMIANYDNPAAPKNDNKWAMEDFGGFTNSTYPTTFEVFNTGGGDNIGSYSNPTADKLITASISSSNPSAVKNEAAYLTQQQPGLFQPQPDDTFGTAGITVWKTGLSGTPQSFEATTQAMWNPEFWFFTK